MKKEEALKEDIRDITIQQEKVLAIFTKDIKEKEYKNLTYLKKDIDFKRILENKEINKLVNFEL